MNMVYLFIFILLALFPLTLSVRWGSLKSESSGVGGWKYLLKWETT